MKFTLFALALATSPLLAAEEGFVALFDGKTGDLYAIVDNKEPFKDNEWMKYVIRVEDGVVNVTVNGKEVVKDFKPEGEQDKLVEGGGLIALQALDPCSTVYYKDIRIKSLD